MCDHKEEEEEEDDKITCSIAMTQRSSTFEVQEGLAEGGWI